MISEETYGLPASTVERGDIFRRFCFREAGGGVSARAGFNLWVAAGGYCIYPKYEEEA